MTDINFFRKDYRIKIIFRGCIIGLALFLGASAFTSPGIETPYVNANISSFTEQAGALQQRILLLGDAGLSSITPLQASLQKAVERAKLAPQQTSVIMLGDNIYANGFPNKKAGQIEFDSEQLEDISHLQAQLQIAKQSNAEIFIVPGNHDWRASQVDTQANYIDAYAKLDQVKAKFVPFQTEKNSEAEIIYRQGISIVFIDSMWLLETDNNTFGLMMQQLEQLLQQSYRKFPDNVILLTAHHPVQSMGPHGGHYTSLGLQIYEAGLSILNGENIQDINSQPYQRLIQGIKAVLAPYSKTVFAAGHDHSLQLFKDENDAAPQYSLVSGAANKAKLTGVGINKNSQFAWSAEGFFEIDILDNGVLLKAYDINNAEPIHQQWLWKMEQAQKLEITSKLLR